MRLTNHKNFPNKNSEFLTGKRPDADARLIRDILGADDKLDSGRDKPYPICASLVKTEVRTAHIETKPKLGITTWVSSCSSS